MFQQCDTTVTTEATKILNELEKYTANWFDTLLAYHFFTSGIIPLELLLVSNYACM